MDEPGADAVGGDEGRDDEALMAELAAGRVSALRALHARHAPIVFRVAARSLDAAAAEEIVQDVFLTVWQKASAFDPGRGAFRAWVVDIARKRALNELRRRGRHPTTDDEAALDAAADPGPSQDEQVWREVRRAAVRAAIEALPPPQRQALTLAFLDELTDAQIASFVRAPLGTAKTRVRAGLGRLRASLALLLLALALVAVLVLARDARREAALRDRALHLVTASDAALLRLVAAPGVPAERHGSFRSRRGADLAVLTLSSFPPDAAHAYEAWARYGDRWLDLGEASPDAGGKALLIAEDTAFAGPPDALVVTLEAPRAHGAAPAGPVLVAWPAPAP